MFAGVGGVTLGVVCSSRPCWYMSTSLVSFLNLVLWKLLALVMQHAFCVFTFVLGNLVLSVNLKLQINFFICLFWYCINYQPTSPWAPVAKWHFLVSFIWETSVQIPLPPPPTCYNNWIIKERETQSTCRLAWAFSFTVISGIMLLVLRHPLDVKLPIILIFFWNFISPRLMEREE